MTTRHSVPELLPLLLVLAVVVLATEVVSQRQSNTAQSFIPGTAGGSSQQRGNTAQSFIPGAAGGSSQQRGNSAQSLIPGTAKGTSEQQQGGGGSVQSYFIPNKCPPWYETSGAYYGHPYDCTKFFQCAFGQPVMKQCWPKTVFSERWSVCVHTGSSYDECTNYRPARVCAAGLADFIPHPTACQRYYNCSDTTQPRQFKLLGLYENECPYPQLFDTNLKRCVPFQTATCGNGRWAAKWECDYVKYKCPAPQCRPCWIDHPSCEGYPDGVWPHPYKMWTSSYVTCKSQRSVTAGEQTCPNHPLLKTPQIFHAKKRRCVSRWEIPKQYNGLEPVICATRVAGIYIDDLVPEVAYKCPEKQLYFCVPPYFVAPDLSRCVPFGNKP